MQNIQAIPSAVYEQTMRETVRPYLKAHARPGECQGLYYEVYDQEEPAPATLVRQLMISSAASRMMRARDRRHSFLSFFPMTVISPSKNVCFHFTTKKGTGQMPAPFSITICICLLSLMTTAWSCGQPARCCHRPGCIWPPPAQSGSAPLWWISSRC